MMLIRKKMYLYMCLYSTKVHIFHKFANTTAQKIFICSHYFSKIAEKMLQKFIGRLG